MSAVQEPNPSTTLEKNRIFFLFLTPFFFPLVLERALLWLSSGTGLAFSCRFGPYEPLPFQNKNEWKSLVAVLCSSWKVLHVAALLGIFSCLFWKWVTNCRCMQAMGRAERKSTPGSEMFIIIILKFWALVIEKMT